MEITWKMLQEMMNGSMSVAVSRGFGFGVQAIMETEMTEV
jgi:hypothetical protein